jgi:hypothetical protein
MHSTRRLSDEPPGRATEAEERIAPADPAVLALQRSAGNAAVARLLARDATFSPFKPGATPGMGGPLDLTKGVGADYDAASSAVRTWFAKLAADARSSEGGLLQSVPELVAAAGQLPFSKADGTQAVVKDVVKPNETELGLREQARHEGVRLLDHRDPSDAAGVRSETQAILANLGAIPTEISFGGDNAKITATISGKVTGEIKAGGVKVEGEASGDGASATVSVPGGGKVEGHVSGEGAGGSVSAPGAKAGFDVTGKGIKAQVKAGDLVTVDASITRDAASGTVTWQAEISIGTIGKLIMPEDVAKVFKGAQDTFSKSAGELVHNLDDPAKVKQHGAALAGAISDVVEKAKKSASQKAGWRVGAELKGDSLGGVSGSITLTWVF